MQIELTPSQAQVDRAINARIERISRTAFVAANYFPDGRKRKVYVPFTHPQEVTDLLAIKQRLYAGEDPESVM